MVRVLVVALPWWGGGGAMNSLEERFAWKTVGLQGTRMLFFVEFLI